MSEPAEREMLEELARRVEARRRAGDYDLPWLERRVEEVQPTTPVDDFLQAPSPSITSGRAARAEADRRLREALTWLKLTADAERAAREEAEQRIQQATHDLAGTTSARMAGVERHLRDLSGSLGERIHRLEDDRRWLAAAMLRQEHAALREPGRGIAGLGSAERRVFSQNGEDGIIAWLLSIVGVTDRRFFEIGIGDGRECNTAALALVFGWRGTMVDAWPEGVAAARELYDSRAESRDTVRVLERTVTRENVGALLADEGFEGEFDLLSIDIDGNDLWVWEAIEDARPRVVVIEYNGTFGPERSVSVPYDPAFDRLAAHESGWYHGASLAALDRVARRERYVLAGCDSNGVNAFFVRADLAAGLIEPVTARNACRPVRERGPRSPDEQFALIAHLPLVEVP